MKSHADINMIRHYCNVEHIKIFDGPYQYKWKFSYLSEGVYRKYLSRLVEEGFFQYIAKGIYYVGWKMPENIDKEIERYFLYDHTKKGIFAGEALLYELGIIERKPETIEILSPLVTKNRNIRNYYVKPLKSHDIETDIFELLELLSIRIDLNEDEQDRLFIAIGERLLTFKGFKGRSPYQHYKIDYPRIVYIKLANMLDQLHISNEVMQWYEQQSGLQD